MLMSIKAILIISLIAILVTLIFMPIDETPKQVFVSSPANEKARITGVHILVNNVAENAIDLKELCGLFRCTNLPTKEEFEELQKEAKTKERCYL